MALSFGWAPARGIVLGLTSASSEWLLPVVGTIWSWQLVFFIVGLPGVLLAFVMFPVADMRSLRKRATISDPISI
jgi:hypothetical protein